MTRRDSGPSTTACALLLLWLCVGAVPARAQEPVWNDAPALDLVGRARVERHAAVVDTAFRSYEADARGYVYFFLDRPDSDERTLIKADQIALQVFWQAPDKTRQRIVGLRDKKVLPTNIHYHLDHLTVVQDDFGDRIRIGDGDEVSEVTHPLAPGSEAVYDFRLADSLSIRYGGGSQEVRVYEIRVRPKDPGAPGYIGSVYLDRATAAIVRMSFTFTPASYVDPYLDYIRISLDNSLWMGRHWLPYRQEVELRREIPQLDFLAGSVIRGRFEIGPYAFNLPLPPQLFAGRGVTAAPEAARRAFPFERGLFDDLQQEGLAPAPSLEEIRAEARRIVTDRALSGLAPVRLYFHSFSDGLRYDRAEGVFVGAGLNLRPFPSVQMRTSAGYAFGRGRPSGSVVLEGAPAPVVPVLEAYWDRLRDLGPYEAVSPLVGSLGAAFSAQDWLDPWFARGARLTLRGPRPDEGPSVTLRWERQASARNVLAGRGFSPVRPITEGSLAAVDASVPFPLPAGGGETWASRSATSASGRSPPPWSTIGGASIGREVVGACRPTCPPAAPRPGPPSRSSSCWEVAARCPATRSGSSWGGGSGSRAWKVPTPFFSRGWESEPSPPSGPPPSDPPSCRPAGRAPATARASAHPSAPGCRWGGTCSGSTSPTGSDPMARGRSSSRWIPASVPGSDTRGSSG